MDKVKITPYMEPVSESSEVNKALDSSVVESRKLGHSPVIISPEDVPSTTESEMVSAVHPNGHFEHLTHRFVHVPIDTNNCLVWSWFHGVA